VISYENRKVTCSSSGLQAIDPPKTCLITPLTFASPRAMLTRVREGLADTLGRAKTGVKGRLKRLSVGCEVSILASGARASALEQLGFPSERRLSVSVGVLNRSDAKLLCDSVRLILGRCVNCHFAPTGEHGEVVPPDLAAQSRFHTTGFVPLATVAEYVLASKAVVALLAATTPSRARWPSKVNEFPAAGRAAVT